MYSSMLKNHINGCHRNHAFFTMQASFSLRVNITIVYEHTLCATSAFSMCMLRAVSVVVLFVSCLGV